MSPARVAASASIALLATACDGVQTTLGGDGVESAQFLTLFQIFLAVTGIVYLLVIAFLLASLGWRRSAGSERHVVETGKHHADSPLLRPALIGWTALIAVGLSTLAIASFFTDRSLARASANEQLAIRVTGNQWWWKVEYLSSDASKTVQTANELHLPVGVPVRVRLESNDVIHSFWVPNLAGKQDLIPGRVADVTLVPRRAGLFRGQCAEFCGVQHAHMALDVTVESRADFERWYAAQLRPAALPRTQQAIAGYRYVTTRECSVCHNIAGTPAGGRVGPDLTHLASRRSIAAGTLPMNRGNLHGWVADPQSQKPGTKMPTIGMNAADLHAIVAYLEQLK
jgi:cytochrome c oxidase subunit 2